MGRWAAGGEEEHKADYDGEGAMLVAVREGVLWYLRRRLEQVGAVWGEMVEVRIERELERGKSSWVVGEAAYEAKVEGMESEAEKRLSPEQLALFEEENSDLLKRYDEEMERVR